MIRGAIDYADHQRVGGWIYSDVAPVGGRTVLAFLDKDCIGAGALDVFRQDLADAGLGDGMVGFNFGVGAADEDMPRVTVRLEGSDFCLIQHQARIAADGNLIETLRSKKTLAVSDIEWMRDHGWLDPIEFELLSLVSSVGIYDHAVGRSSPEAEARRILELYAQGPLAVAAETMTPAEMVGRRLPLMAELKVPIVAAQGTSGALGLLEGSNGDEDFYRHKDMLGAVQHPFAAGKLLFIDLRSQMDGIGEKPMTVYLPR